MEKQEKWVCQAKKNTIKILDFKQNRAWHLIWY